MSSKQRTLIIPPALIPFLQTFYCVYAYMQAKAEAGNGTEAEPGDSDTAANQRFITQPSSLLPSGDSHHLCSHSQGGEPWWDSFCICVCLFLTNTIIRSCFLLMPHQLINHSWEQRGVSIDNTYIPWEGNSESRYPVTSNSSFIQIPHQMEQFRSLFNKIMQSTVEAGQGNNCFSAWIKYYTALWVIR